MNTEIEISSKLTPQTASYTCSLVSMCLPSFQSSSLLLPSCLNLFNTSCLLYTISIMPCLLNHITSFSPLLTKPQRSYLVQGAPSPLPPALGACRRGQICECSPPACFSLALFGSDATINHTAGTDKVNRERGGSERVREGGRREEDGVGWGGGPECSATQHSDLPCSTCLCVCVCVFVYETDRERRSDRWE